MGREALEEGQEGSEVSPGEPGGVGRPSRMVGRGQNGQEGSGVPPRTAERIGRLSQRAKRVWKSLPESRERLEGPGEVGSPSRRAERGQ